MSNAGIFGFNTSDSTCSTVTDPSELGYLGSGNGPFDTSTYSYMGTSSSLRDDPSSSTAYTVFPESETSR